MGDLIDGTTRFRMAKLEADVARAGIPKGWGTSTLEMERRAAELHDLQSYELHRSNMVNGIIRAKEYNTWLKEKVDDIILPPTLEED